ncbi:MAG: CRISPR-associated endonuclease Cas1 [Elusimicrobia bacterium]|nr:CRISPR-associated endonuclease Cas1 [Elusimicrobiota bacterium]
MDKHIFSDFPVQYGLFSNQPEEVVIDFENIFLVDSAKWRFSPNVFLVKSEQNSELILSGHGVKLSKKNGRLAVKDGDKIVYELPFFRLSHINVQSKGVSISSDVIEETIKKGIKLVFSSFSGKPYAMIISPLLNAPVKTKRNQIMAYNNEKGVVFAKQIVAGKINNQANLLKYMVKNIKDKKTELFRNVYETVESICHTRDSALNISGKNVSECRSSLMGLEGSAAKKYWSTFGQLLGPEINFTARENKGSASNVVNALLNYGYGMLYSIVWGAVVNAGLEPFAGFLHTDLSGKPSMVLDLVEEFRAPIIDRTVSSFLNLGGSTKMQNDLLSLATRRDFSKRVLERFESTEYFNGKRFQTKLIIQAQARYAASFFRGDGEYKYFSFKW